jgi:hypothetical protein
MGIVPMIGIRILEVMFAVGGLGSVIVFILSGIEDVETLAGSKDTDY